MQGKITIRAAYGAWRDLQVYNELGLQPDQIFIFNKGGKKQDSKKLTRDCQVSRCHSWIAYGAATRDCTLISGSVTPPQSLSTLL